MVSFFSITLILVGLILRIISIKHLGDNFSLQLGKPKEIIKTGIYKYVRHPSYIGSIMFISGLFLINERIGFVYFLFIFFLSRTKQEEQILEYHYEKEYRLYKDMTGGLFPKLRKNRKVKQLWQ